MTDLSVTYIYHGDDDVEVKSKNKRLDGIRGPQHWVVHEVSTYLAAINGQPEAELQSASLKTTEGIPESWRERPAGPPPKETAKAKKAEADRIATEEARAQAEDDLKQAQKSDSSKSMSKSSTPSRKKAK